MKLTLILLFPIVLTLAACGSRASSNSSDYVGEYVFRPANTSPGKFATFVILRPDHEAVEIRFDKVSGQVQTNEEKWYLSRTTGQNVVIGNFSCPVQASRGAIKLGIDDDLGQFYEKVR